MHGLVGLFGYCAVGEPGGTPGRAFGGPGSISLTPAPIVGIFIPIVPPIQVGTRPRFPEDLVTYKPIESRPNFPRDPIKWTFYQPSRNAGALI